MGKKLELQEILDDMTLLTDCSLKNCKNNRKQLVAEITRRWKEGILVSEWTGQTIHPTDVEGYDEHVKAEMARLTAPILTAMMIQKVKKYARRKIKMIFHITGFPDAVRFMKNRLHHVNQVPEYILRSNRYADLFQGKPSIE